MVDRSSDPVRHPGDRGDCGLDILSQSLLPELIKRIVLIVLVVVAAVVADALLPAARRHQI